MISINPYKQLDKITLKDGTEIPTNGMILSARADLGEFAHLTIMIKTSELREIIKTEEEIQKEMKEKGIQ